MESPKDPEELQQLKQRKNWELVWLTMLDVAWLLLLLWLLSHLPWLL